VHRFCVHLHQRHSRCCNTLQHTATHCNTLQHTATVSFISLAFSLLPPSECLILPHSDCSPPLQPTAHKYSYTLLVYGIATIISGYRLPNLPSRFKKKTPNFGPSLSKILMIDIVRSQRTFFLYGRPGDRIFPLPRERMYIHLNLREPTLEVARTEGPMVPCVSKETHIRAKRPGK